MPNIHKGRFLSELAARFGSVQKLGGGQSLFAIDGTDARIYVRYSRLHDGGRSFFGLRDVDLRELEGHNSYICFIVDDDSQPVLVPFADFEEIFRGSQAAVDGQHKVQLVRSASQLELYVARQGRFNVEAFVGFAILEGSLHDGRLVSTPVLTHSQVQTFLAGIGNLKGYDVWIPASDCARIEWNLTGRFSPMSCVPAGYDEVAHILSEVDVVWIARGANTVEGLFEVEHTTSIYSGLLRFNDLLLTNPKLSHFSIVSDDNRRSVFARQLHRPTFQKSGLSELTSFLDYRNVYQWHSRLTGTRSKGL